MIALTDGKKWLTEALDALTAVERKKGNLNLQMPGDPRYQPNDLRPYLGYDQWAGWLVIVEWFWLLTLAKIGVMPKQHAKYLTVRRLQKLLFSITTTMQDYEEKQALNKTNHDILALLRLMRKYLPPELQRWLHFGATSYDIINTAYALQIAKTYDLVFWPKLCEVDELWRQRIAENAEVVCAGRTHLQTALPVTVGFWLANLHSRFVLTARQAGRYAHEVPGKVSGAVGSFAAQRELFGDVNAEKMMLDLLGLPQAAITTQITPPEGAYRCYSEMVLLSGAMANLGEDVRILQSSMCGELTSASSSSSTMAHKMTNPIAAENDAGMHVIVIAAFNRLLLTLVCDLQRDLRWSCVMRGYSEVMVYTYEQMLTTLRILKSLVIDSERCRQNFAVDANVVMAELLYLSLQQQGFIGAHEFVNRTVVPLARLTNQDLGMAMDSLVGQKENKAIRRAWKKVPVSTKELLRNPQLYVGDAVKIAQAEAEKTLWWEAGE
ncbi:MAG: lyase family protein [Candidatus Buchananbacteria bacterium]|jgi:adenylosuccinate lyase